jgi:hypothetical protein
MKGTPTSSDKREIIGLVCGDAGCEAIYTDGDGEDQGEKRDHNTRHMPPEQPDD